MAEEVILRRGNIEITRTMAKFGSITYPIAGIGSVYVAAPNRQALEGKLEAVGSVKAAIERAVVLRG